MPRSILPTGSLSVHLGGTPPPEPLPHGALCRTTHSLISPGTERWQIERSEGLSAAEIAAAGLRLGYCGAGIVEKLYGDMDGLAPGDRAVYYGGPYVSHSEQVAVPRPLIRRVPEGLPIEQAMFMGLGAISLHGFRQGRPGLGETVLVTGLGVLGNMCAQFAALAGCRVLATDMHPGRVELLQECTAGRLPHLRAVPYDQFHAAAGEAGRHTGGVDAALVCVSSKTSGPIHDILPLLRPGARIVAVGLLELAFPRDDFFAKEFEFSVSRAAGPGRYDVSYERDGVDYPVKHVRWTEGRNLAETLALIAEGRLNVKPLLSAVYPISRVADAYRAVFDDPGQTGIAIDWTNSPTGEAP